MDKLLRLPPGFRFHPTDEELVVQYLRRKVFSCPLPASIIPEIRLGERNPWDLLGSFPEKHHLVGGGEQEVYFFDQREEKYAKGRRSNRTTGPGYWKATGKDKAVVGSKCNRVVGMKKTLVFYRGEAPNVARSTGWVMHEYSLASSTRCGVAAAAKDWVLCRVSKKKRAANMDIEESERPRFTGSMIRPSSPTDSDSSCVTETSDEPSSP